MESEDSEYRRGVIREYRKKLLQLKELESSVRIVSENVRGAEKELAETDKEREDVERRREYLHKLLQRKELESRVRTVQESLRGAKKELAKIENYLKSPRVMVKS